MIGDIKINIADGEEFSRLGEENLAE